MNSPRRDEFWLVTLDPTKGSELQKTRPCLIISPNEVNASLRTVIIAPMTTTELIRHGSTSPFKTNAGKWPSIRSEPWTGSIWFARSAPPRKKPRKRSLPCWWKCSPDD